MKTRRIDLTVRTITMTCLFSSLLLWFAGCVLAPKKGSLPPCSDPLGCVTLQPGDPVILGVLQTLSGGSAPAGVEQERSIRLAVEMRGGKVLGHPIELKVEDEHCSEEGGANAALRVVANPQVVGILGTNCSSAAVTAAKIMSEKGLVMVSSANTSPALTSINRSQGINWHLGYFRTAWNDALMGRAAAEFAFKELGITQAAVINAGDAYTKGLTDMFQCAFEEKGGKVVLEATVDEEDPDLGPTLDAVALSNAKLVFFPLSHPETGSRIVLGARQMEKLRDLVFIGGEGMFSNVFIQQVGSAGGGVYVLGPSELDSAKNEQLEEAYHQKYGEDPPSFYYSFTVDAVNLLLNAIEKSATQGPDGALLIPRTTLRNVLYATNGFDGYSGRLTCDSFGDCGAAKLNIVQLDDQVTEVEALRSRVIYTYTAKP